MQTEHRVVVDDARSMDQLDDDSVELVVTSPPYPMIELWDDLFTQLDPAIETCLTDGKASAAFERMHDVLEPVWTELARVLVDGGIACINIGDATRSVDDRFRVFQNHARLIEIFESLGFDPLPDILWRKPSNSTAKFMGSGMLPPNAYTTLEHEYLLVFRNGSASRSFEPGADRRYEAAYFWEERNEWFSDLWTDIGGTFQALDDDALRERSAAFPFEIPYRLINMYSVYGDTVLDPFWGTGTTSLAAMISARNSVGYELESGFGGVFDDRVTEAPALAREIVGRRIVRHREFVRDRLQADETVEYEASNYDFSVMTQQERSIQFYVIDEIVRTDWGYSVSHEPVTEGMGEEIDELVEE